jgi:predicted RNase H-like nuclease (RuvC/YqgF family)
MGSEIDSLRQENSRLMAKVTGLEAEKMELRRELKARTDELEKNYSKFFS